MTLGLVPLILAGSALKRQVPLLSRDVRNESGELVGERAGERGGRSLDDADGLVGQVWCVKVGRAGRSESGRKGQRAAAISRPNMNIIRCRSLADRADGTRIPRLCHCTRHPCGTISLNMRHPSRPTPDQDVPSHANVRNSHGCAPRLTHRPREVSITCDGNGMTVNARLGPSSPPSGAGSPKKLFRHPHRAWTRNMP